MTEHAGRTRTAGILAALSAVLIWAGWIPVTRLGVIGHLNPTDVTALRYGTSGLILLPFFWRHRRSVPWHRPGWLALVTIGAGAPYFLLFGMGLRLANSGQAAVFGPGASSVFTLLLARVWLGEAITLARNIIDATGGGPVIAGGHSYGGRLTSMAVADGDVDLDTLTLFSYPLHPPGKPDRLRTEHFGAIAVPTVFTHGTADPFGSINELRAAAGLITASTEIVEITGARHDLASKTLDVPALAVRAALRRTGTGYGRSGTVGI
jgi:hypothetical protein